MRKNILVLCASLVLCFIVLEIVFRIISPKTPPGTTYGKIVHKNSIGLRDHEFAVPKPAGTFRIVVLGDSFVWGIGLDLGETLPKRIEQTLRPMFPDRNIEVVNAAMNGYNTTLELALLKKRGFYYQPDLVLLVYNLNDAEPTPEVKKPGDTSLVVGRLEEGREAEKYSHETGIRGVIAWFEARSDFIKFLVPRVGGILRNMNLLSSSDASWVQKTFDGYTDENPGWRESRAALVEMQTICREKGIPLVVAIYPLLVQLDDYKGKKAHAAIRQVCEEHDIPVVDLLTVFEHKKAEALWVNFMDGHPSAEAHLLATYAIVPVLADQIRALNSTQARAVPQNR